MGGKDRWASRTGLVFAMAGNAVGLGNFLRFPAQTAANGGGAFLIPYLVALVVIGIPLIWVEWAMGRYGGQHGHHSTPGIFDAIGRRPFWKYIGVFGLWSNLIIAAFYLYIESWTMAYASYSLLGGFETTDPSQYFNRITGEQPAGIWSFSVPGLVMFGLCVGLNIWILSRGLTAGIELVCKIGMPLLMIFAVLLAVRALLIVPATEPAGWAIADAKAVASPFDGLRLFWEPKFDRLWNPTVWLAAAGQMFFTLSLGMGSIHCYASYLREKDDIVLSSSAVVWTSEFCKVILGSLLLIPIAVAYFGVEQVQALTAGGSGFDIGFRKFPILFLNWGFLAPIAGFLWFTLLFFAALTSSIAMGQPIVSFLQSEFGYSRQKSALAFGLMLLPLALPVALLHSRSFLYEFDYWAGSFALILFALAETILFAWVFGMDRAWEEITKGAQLKIPRAFAHFIKFVTPTFLLLILIAYTFHPVGRVEVADPKTNERRIEARGWRPYITGWFSSDKMQPWEWSREGMIGKLLNRDLTDEKLALQQHLVTTSLTDAQHKAARDQLAFIPTLRILRRIDRGVMICAFLFCCGLVWFAWRKRAANEDGPAKPKAKPREAAKEVAKEIKR
ncbi:sodium-dependent transporter [Anatilimnocola floriformis]|uniref:sodium-dependent transporter n=1 Tax=Anatilimnocola floriformis TaxID=2948575 RepID=UPI0020C3C9F1|nr:sodium-dependent transporter [Anatilimnocola floriformis]